VTASQATNKGLVGILGISECKDNNDPASRTDLILERFFLTSRGIMLVLAKASGYKLL